MQFVTLEDEQGVIEAVLRPGVFAALGASVSDPGPLLVSGRVESDHGDLMLSVSEVGPFHQRDAPYRTGAMA
jgi:DNA polymerase III alpha subunit